MGNEDDDMIDEDKEQIIKTEIVQEFYEPEIGHAPNML